MRALTVMPLREGTSAKASTFSERADAHSRGGATPHRGARPNEACLAAHPRRYSNILSEAPAPLALAGSRMNESPEAPAPHAPQA